MLAYNYYPNGRQTIGKQGDGETETGDVVPKPRTTDADDNRIATDIVHIILLTY